MIRNKQRQSTKGGHFLAAAFSAVLLGITMSAADGLPGEHVVTQRWRDLLSAHSPLTNPAFMTEENYTSLRGVFSTTLREFKLWELGVVIPIGLYQSVGMTWVGENGGDFAETIWNTTSATIEQTDKTLSSQKNFFAFSYAINPINRLSVGGSFTIAQENIFDKTSAGIGIDLGVTYRLVRHPIIGDHIVGLSAQNLLAPKLTGENATTEYARNIRASWVGKVWEKRIDAGIDLDIKDILSSPDQFRDPESIRENLSGIIEYDFNARLGVWLLRIIRAYFQIGSDYWGLSGGINAPTVNNGRDLQIMYQYMNMTTGDEATSHSVYLRGDVGKHREELYARRMARLANISPNELYIKALTLFSNNKYWDAFYVFGRILVEYPDFFKNDWVSYYLALCEEAMDMRGVSVEAYEKMKKDYPRSNAVPHADLGLMRIYYSNDKSGAVATQMAKLNRPDVPDSLKYHAFYLMAQTHMQTGQRAKAIQLFSLIPETHPDYLFAQHSAAVCHAIDNRMEDAIDALDNCIQAITKTREQKEIVNRSYVLLGYIFYEGLGGSERALSKAVTALRAVDSDSYYYEDALLGMAWTALKAQQWVDCINNARTLRTTTNKPALQCEAALLEAYCYMMQKKYAAAVDVLAPANEKIIKIAPPTKTEKAANARLYAETRAAYDVTGRTAQQLALTNQTTLVLDQIDSLHTHQLEGIKKIDGHLKWQDEYVRSSFFARNIGSIRDDIDYALAKAQKMAGSSDVQKIQEKAVEKTQDIDEEMKKLKEQLESLEE